MPKIKKGNVSYDVRFSYTEKSTGPESPFALYVKYEESGTWTCVSVGTIFRDNGNRYVVKVDEKFVHFQNMKACYDAAASLFLKGIHIADPLQEENSKSSSLDRLGSLDRSKSVNTFQYLDKDGEYAQKLNKTKDLAQNIASIDRDNLVDEYKNLKKDAPRRSSRNKHYFGRHGGVPAGSRDSNRYEEHLAMVLWNCKEWWPHPNGSRFYLLDYQFPLKAWQSDKGIGRIDLFGLTDQGRLMIIEMKVQPLGDNNRGETPVAAMLQGLRYAAIVQANQEEIAEEVMYRCNIPINQDPPVVQVLAPKDWWQGWLDLSKSARRHAGDWETAFIKLSEDIEQQIGISIECLEIETSRSALTFGRDGQPPRLNHTPKFTYPSFWR